MNKKITVIIPVYNSEKYIQEALMSLNTQTYQHFKVLIIDDKSTDNSIQKIKDIVWDFEYKIIENRKDKGIVGALNTGLEMVDTEFVARLDGDDICRPDRFEKQIAYFEKHKNCYLLGGGYAPFNEKGQIREIYHPGCPNILAWKYLRDAFLCHPSVMFKSTIINEVGYYQNTGAEDYALFSEVIKLYEVNNLQEIIIDYREHDSNLSKVNVTNILKSVDIISRSNYEYFAKTADDYALVKKFQERNHIRYGEMPSLLFRIFNIANNIRLNYKQSIFDIDNLKLHMFLIKESLLLLFRKFKITLKLILKK